MGWVHKDVAQNGEFVMVTVTDGFFIDPLGTVTSNDIIDRMREHATGWTPTHIDWRHGLFGMFGESIRIFGRANESVPVSLIQNQSINALNSFWSIGGAGVSVALSDSLAVPVPSGGESWSTTLQMAALAVTVVAVVWGITQLRKTIA